MKFEIEPYVGTSYIKFGMSQDEVIHRMGKPQNESRNYFGDLCFIYFGISIGFRKNDNLVDHIGIGEDINVFLNNINVFTDPEALNKLMMLDGDPYRYLEDIYLLKLGVCLSGFESDVDCYEKSIVIFTENANLDVKQKGEKVII